MTTETDSTPFLPSSILMRSTNPRIGWREVGKLEIMWQSKTDMRGLTRPSAVAATISTSSSARSTKSVCGNSL
jgi:hypothetical protein